MPTETEDNVLMNNQLVFSGGDDTDSRVVDITAEDNTTRVLMVPRGLVPK